VAVRAGRLMRACLVSVFFLSITSAACERGAEPPRLQELEAPRFPDSIRAPAHEQTPTDTPDVVPETPPAVPPSPASQPDPTHEGSGDDPTGASQRKARPRPQV
jgi:hypothetical protein